MSLLVGCYAFLVLLAAGLLVFVLYSPYPAASVQDLISGHGASTVQILAEMKVAVWMLRDRMHNTWFFLYVFLAIWLTVLAWEMVARRSLELSTGLKEVYFMGWISLSVLSTAVLYGVGTNGILARRYPKAVPAADALAVGFVLALPVIAWARLQRQRLKESEEEQDERRVSYHRVHTSLGLFDQESSERLLETPEVRKVVAAEARLEPKPVLATAPSAQAIAAVDHLVESAGLPAVNRLVRPAETNKLVTMETAKQMSVPEPQEKSVDSFRRHLSTLNESWDGIEKAGREIDQWFDEQRRQVLAHLEKHPGIRGQEMPLNLSKDFLNEKLNAVDADWAAIRKSALEICRWFGDIPGRDS